MDEMEDIVQALHTKNDTLTEECRRLREINRQLILENADLKLTLTSRNKELQNVNTVSDIISKSTNDISASSCDCKSARVDCTHPDGPAVSQRPLQKGDAVQSAGAVARCNVTTLAVMLILSWMVSRNSQIQNLTLTDLKNLLRVYSKKSPQSLNQFLQKEK